MQDIKKIKKSLPPHAVFRTFLHLYNRSKKIFTLLKLIYTFYEKVSFGSKPFSSGSI